MTSVNEFDQDDLGKPELDGDGLEKPDPEKNFDIQIDRVTYQISETRMTGADLRRVPEPPIPADRDLFEIIPGRPDRKVEDDDRILISDGLRFFTAPNTINPGSIPAGH
jgi:hypothetical protein